MQPSLRGILKSEARDALIFTGSNLLNKFGGLLLIPLYMTKLSPTDFGVIAVISIIGMFQSVISTLTLELGVMRYYYEWNAEERDRNVGAVWTWSLIAGALGACVTITSMLFLTPLLFPGVPFYPWVLLGLLGNACTNFMNIPITTLRIRRMPVLFAGYNLANFLLYSGLAVIFVLVLESGLTGYLIANLLAGAAMTLLGVAFMLATTKPCLASPGLRQVFHIAFPAIPASLLSSVGLMLDRWLLNYFGGLHLLGILSLAMKFADGISGLHSSLKLAFAPFVFKTIARDKEGGPETIAKVTPFYLAVYFAAGMGLSIFIEDFIAWVGRPEYLPVSQWVPWLAALTILVCLNFYYSQGILLAKRSDLLWIPNAASLAALIAAGILLIRQYQMSGLVVTRFLSTAAYLGVATYISQRLFPIPQRWGKHLAMAALAVAGTLAGLALDGLPAALGLPAKVFLLAGFGFLCFLFILRTRDVTLAQTLALLRRR